MHRLATAVLAYPNGHLRKDVAQSLLGDLEAAFHELLGCLADLHQFLDMSEPNLVQLTILRLKLSHLRLNRGSLVKRVSDFLAGTITESEAALLEEMKAAHQCLLASGVDHTAKWTLDAVEENWSEFRQATKLMVRQWQTKAHQEQAVLYPLILRYADYSKSEQKNDPDRR